jgi:hypothetical protein
MTRKIISDMIVTKRSIREIPISPEKRHKIEKEIEQLEEEDFDSPPRITKPANWQRRQMNPKFIIWLIAILCLLALIFGISILFSSATVVITPRTQKIIFTNDTYTARADPQNATDLTFEVLKVNQTIGETVLATEEKEVKQKASGKIIIYNNYSTAPQRLINNTRFEATNGNVYRINSSVVVPGLKKVGGKIVPGSVEAIVYADQPGESYNMNLADMTGDFKIPGFKGDVRYDSFYARLKEDITGGFIGMQRIIGEDLREETENTIKTKLREQLLKELYAIMPENYLVFKDAYSVDFSNLPDTAVDKDKAKINIQGTLNAIVFNNIKLGKYMATKKISDFDNNQTEFIPSDDLVTIFSGKDTTSLAKNDTLEIKLNGQATIKWSYDSDIIKKDLTGRKGSDIRNLASKYKDSVISMEVIFRPVWTRYFPDKEDKIEIKEAVL